MSATLFCKVGPLAGTECQVGEEATIGSDAGNGLVLSAASISPRHARIRFHRDQGCYRLENLAGHGLALDGEAVDESMSLHRLHVITFAQGYDFFFRWNGEPPRPAQADEAGEAVREAEEPHQAPGEKTLFRKLRDVLSPPAFQPSSSPSQGREDEGMAEEALVTLPLEAQEAGEKTNFELERGSLSPPSFRDAPAPSASEPQDEGVQPGESSGPAGQGAFILDLETELWSDSFPLRQGENTLGRSSKCEVSVKDATISRRHAVLTVDSGKVRVRDLGSMNKSYVAGEQIEGETEVALDTALRFGRLKGRIRLNRS